MASLDLKKVSVSCPEAYLPGLGMRPRDPSSRGVRRSRPRFLPRFPDCRCPWRVEEASPRWCPAPGPRASSCWSPWRVIPCNDIWSLSRAPYGRQRKQQDHVKNIPQGALQRLGHGSVGGGLGAVVSRARWGRCSSSARGPRLGRRLRKMDGAQLHVHRDAVMFVDGARKRGRPCL